MKLHIRIIPTLLGLSCLTLIWLWIFGVLPFNLPNIIWFIAFFIAAAITEAVGESQDEKKLIQTALDVKQLRQLVNEEIAKNLRRN
jgi:uncharacterized membrane-anchored protein YitT (DUF2179 family)